MLRVSTWVILVALHTPTTPNVAAALGPCGNPCTVSYNAGGIVREFQAAADEILRTKQKLVIDGYCASSCMVLADRARSQTCITYRAQFGYHRTNFDRPIPLRADINQWIMRRGGYPKFGARPGIMSNVEARKFWPLCKSTVDSKRNT